MMRLWWAVALLTGRALPASSLKISGSMRGSDSWRYLGRFCFLPKDQHVEGEVRGQVTVVLTFPINSRLTLLKYLERPSDYAGTSVTSFDSWSEVYNGNLNCSERMDVADKVRRIF
jgi:hypothetical protein